MTKKPRKEDAPSAELLELARQNKPKATGVTLQKITRFMEEVRSIDQQLADLSEQAKRLSDRRSEICGGGQKRGELVDLFEQCGISDMTLAAAGNSAAMLFELADWMSISQQSMTTEQKDAMFALLRKSKLDPFIKNTITVELEKGSDKLAREVAKFLRSRKLSFDQKPSVNSGTLKAEIRRRDKTGKPFDPAELETLGVTRGRVMSIKPLTAA